MHKDQRVLRVLPVLREARDCKEIKDLLDRPGNKAWPDNKGIQEQPVPRAQQE